MTASLADSDTFAFNDGNAGHVCDFGSAPAVGQWDILAVNSNTTVSTPAGFTLAETAVTNQGTYFFVREAVGGEGSTVTITTSGNHHTAVGWSRWNAIDDLDTSTHTEVNSSTGNSSPAHNTGALSTTGQLVIAFSANHSIVSANQNTPVWSSGYAVLTSVIQGTSTTGVLNYVGYKHNAGTAAETPSVSWSGDVAFNRYMLVLTFTTLADITSELDASMPAVTASGSATVTDEVAEDSGGSWDGLLSILDYARELAREERAAAPVACPLCGEPLESGPRGELHCPFDGWIWRGYGS
jgi:hypothetical protein